jgi:hypothetical protein
MFFHIYRTSNSFNISYIQKVLQKLLLNDCVLNLQNSIKVSSVKSAGTERRNNADAFSLLIADYSFEIGYFSSTKAPVQYFDAVNLLKGKHVRFE